MVFGGGRRSRLARTLGAAKCGASHEQPVHEHGGQQAENARWASRGNGRKLQAGRVFPTV